MDHRPPSAASLLLPRRPDLVIAPQDEGGSVLKDPRTGSYYRLGPHESFLLQGLDGRRSADELRAAFQKQFGEPLTREELQEFLDMAKAQGFVGAPAPRPAAAPPAPEPTPPPSGQSLFYWRKSLLDPDRLFAVIEPHVRFVWTPAFVAFSLVGIAAAGLVAWPARGEIAGAAVAAVSWETALVAWLAIALVTTCHEFAHGLTCKYHGGEVREVGFLMMFLMPCFYCNVSDAWLLPGKWARMAVTAAGAYCDLCLWALAVFAWRLTPPGVWANHAALVVMSVCGFRTFLNLNPFLKLDGYYLLSDYLEAPNLLPRAQAHLKGTARWLLWGAAAPAPEPGGRWLLLYGALSWLFPLAMISLFLWGVGGALASVAGPAGAGLALAGAAFVLSGHFAGLFGPEVREMARTRHGRTAVWALGLAGAALALAYWEWEDRAHGTFVLRPTSRVELRAEVAGFLRVADADEGDAVAAGQRVALLEVPHLESKLSQKRAEQREALARLKLLQIGPRPEVVAAQRLRVDRAEAWRDLADKDLRHAREVYRANLAAFDEQLAQAEAERGHAQASFARAEPLFRRRAISEEEFGGIRKRNEVSESRYDQVAASRRARVQTGTLAAESELARRTKDLAEADATLGLLEAGSRPEEIDAEQARLERLREEIAHQERLKRRQAVHAPAAGVVTTPRVREGVGKYFREGELICVVEEPARLEAEIAVPEREMARVRPGLAVEFKLPVLPMETFTGAVDRVAPRAAGPANEPAADQNTVTLHSVLHGPTPLLRPGMTGHARVSCGPRPLGELIADRAMRYLRTEFWWW